MLTLSQTPRHQAPDRMPAQPAQSFGTTARPIKEAVICAPHRFQTDSMIQGRTDAARRRCAPRRPDPRAGQLPFARWFLLFCLSLAAAGGLRGAELPPSADQAGASPHYNI